MDYRTNRRRGEGGSEGYSETERVRQKEDDNTYLLFRLSWYKNVVPIFKTVFSKKDMAKSIWHNKTVVCRFFGHDFCNNLELVKDNKKAKFTPGSLCEYDSLCPYRFEEITMKDF